MPRENRSLPIVSWRPLLVWLLALLSAAAVAASGGALYEKQRANSAIKRLIDRKDIAIDTRHAQPEEILARVNELIRRDRLDEAQAVLGAADTRLPAATRSAILYNLANARTRAAVELVRKGDIDGATARVNLAKSEYRLALKLVPDDWNARFNIDVAMRIVRDLPVGDGTLDDDKPAVPKRLWTDLPGIPKGLP